MNVSNRKLNNEDELVSFQVSNEEYERCLPAVMSPVEIPDVDAAPVDVDARCDEEEESGGEDFHSIGGNKATTFEAGQSRSGRSFTSSTGGKRIIGFSICDDIYY